MNNFFNVNYFLNTHHFFLYHAQIQSDTLYECEGISTIIRTLSAELIVINLKKKHISTWSPCFQHPLSTCQQASSFSHKIQFIYFPIHLFLEACVHDLRFDLHESTTAQTSNAAEVGSQKAPDFQLFWFMLNRCTYLRFAFLFHSQL